MNTFYPSGGIKGCRVCALPELPIPPETPCSEKMLPDPTRAYLLAVETPFTVDFSYPGLSPWNQDVANPFSTTLSGPQSTMPATAIITDATNGYEFRTTLTDLGDIWNPRLITGLNPVVIPGDVITPGTVVDLGSRLACTWTSVKNIQVASSTIERLTTISPPANTVLHPSHWNYRSVHPRTVDVTMVMTYQVDTPDITVPDWTSASTNFSITVSFQIRENGNGLPYWKPIATSIPVYTYGAEIPIPLFGGGFAPCMIPYAFASRTYRYTTNNRTSFMSASSFNLTRVTPTSQPSISGLGGSSTVYDLTDKTTTKIASDAIFAVWGGGLGWTTYAPGSSQKTLFSSGDMSDGWPTKLVVSRTAFT